MDFFVQYGIAASVGAIGYFGIYSIRHGPVEIVVVS